MPKRIDFLTSDGRPLSYGSAVALRRNFGLGPRTLLSVVKVDPEADPEDHEDDRRQIRADHVSDL